MKALGPQDPQSIGEYRLMGRLGVGGMGQVYMARSGRGRTVALKLVLPELARQPQFRQRFRNEVEAARRIGGHWTAPVLDADLDAATPWVATGYVAGPSLHEVVADEHGPLPERSVIALANGLTHALRDIHNTGLVHRDLKPSNVLITIDGPRVIDFGIARAVGDSTSALTQTGATVGSPGFMSPEQCRGEQLTAASDIFCLGSVLAFAATGRSPFGDPYSAMHVLMLRIIQDEKNLDGIPDRLRELITACLAPTPAARPGLEELLRLTADGNLWHHNQDNNSNQFLKQSPEPWLPGTLIAGLGRRAVGLLDSEEPQAGPTPTAVTPETPSPFGATPPSFGAAPTPTAHATGYGTPPMPPGGVSPYAPTAFGGPPPQPAGYGTPPATPAPRPPGQRSYRSWIIAACSAALVVLLVITISNMGDSDDGGGTTSDAGSSNSSRKNIDDLGTPNGKYQTYTFSAGETARYRSKRTITVSPVEAYVPDSADPAAQTPDPGYKAYTFTVTIRNTGAESIETYFSPEVTLDGGAKADNISGDGYGTSLDGTIPPGQMLTGKFAYVAPRDSKVLNVKHDLYDSTVWTLKLS
ncbi:serine/threonine-protein kinase [Streptomyces sp. ME19-01-6]|uniref:serine/threonine-protein kinase n=1 Tax=Streptomyces sp. ME19-01-6 TaxID=3028686 RepID=UPI0029A1A553|nr:protein kinase [Streptomyces sp. ME19-01-6]MDX3226726.1 protein kinase [Streptomyces sp. ME19-01-6]